MDIMESSAFDSFGKKVGGKKRFLVQKESLGFEPLNPKPKISLSLFNCLFCSFIRLIRAHKDVQWKLTPSTRASVNALLASSSTTK